jgi:hypothetical protein
MRSKKSKPDRIKTKSDDLPGYFAEEKSMEKFLRKCADTMRRATRRVCLVIFSVILIGCDFTGAQTDLPSSGGNARQKLTAAQWREDLQFALDTFLEHDRSFSPKARQDFRQIIANLQKTAEGKTDQQIIVELAKAVALSQNAHTRLYILRNRSELRRYPIRVWWFADGLYVVRATPKYSGILGARILKIAGQPAEQVKKAVDPLFAGNLSWRKYMSAYTMTSPDVLLGLGLIDSDGKAEFEFEDRRGKREKIRLEPLPFIRSDQPVESWWDLIPARSERDGSWSSALTLDGKLLPLYLQNTEKQYWSQYLAKERLYYIQFNRSGNAPNGEPFAGFGNRVLTGLQAEPVKKLVVDVRFNTGGNLDVAREFTERLAALARERKIKIYVITGRATFSAGLYHAMQLRQLANAILVGEPAGDELDFWAEGGNLLMPNSRLTLHYADRFHSYSIEEKPEMRQFIHNFSDLSVVKSTPDIPVEMSASHYFAGRDLALEAVIGDR